MLWICKKVEENNDHVQSKYMSTAFIEEHLRFSFYLFNKWISSENGSMILWNILVLNINRCLVKINSPNFNSGPHKFQNFNIGALHTDQNTNMFPLRGKNSVEPVINKEMYEFYAERNERLNTWMRDIWNTPVCMLTFHIWSTDLPLQTPPFGSKPLGWSYTLPVLSNILPIYITLEFHFCVSNSR